MSGDCLEEVGERDKRASKIAISFFLSPGTGKS